MSTLPTRMILVIALIYAVTGCGSPSSTTRLEQQFATPPELVAGTLLTVTGINRSRSEQTLVIRMDDQPEPGYANRINLERVIPTGSFKIKVPLHGLKTPSGRAFSPQHLQQIIVFAANENSPMELTAVDFLKPRPLGHGAKGWDLGAASSPLWPGFTPLTINSPWLKGSMLKAIDRSHKKQAADALSSDGIRGIESLHLPLSAGQWHITLWLRDPGEWEYLPHPRQRLIHAEGQPVHQWSVSPQQWIAQEYLRGIQREPEPADTSWHLFGRRQSHRVSFPVMVDDDGLQLTFQGDQPEAGFVAAVLAEPEPDYPERYAVEAERAQWWHDNWPIKAWPLFSQSITDYNLHGLRLEAINPKPLKAAPGTVVSINLKLHHRGMPAKARMQLTNPSFGPNQLPASIRWGQWQVRRSGLSSTLLEPDNSLLRAGQLPPLDSHPMPRRLNVLVQVPEHVGSGTYTGQLQVQVGQERLVHPIEIQVLDIQLPPADRPIGVYLDRAVHFDWFRETRVWAERQEVCDLRFLKQLGMTGIAPPLATPDTGSNQARLLTQLTRIHEIGYLSPVIAYTPVKRLLASTGSTAATVDRLQRVDQQLMSGLQPRPAWVSADEPSNPGQQSHFQALKQQTSATDAPLTLAGHLNHSKDEDLAHAFDLLLVNEGFGANLDRIHQFQQSHRQVWLYNLGAYGKPASWRAASGFFLWQTQADGFLQWHARMPTADPFDPTDGRESDVQLLYPSHTPCEPIPPIDARLLELVEGIQDLRWMLWLEYQAKRRTDAQSLLKELTRVIPDDWKIMNTVPVSELALWRQKIEALALKYSTKI